MKIFLSKGAGPPPPPLDPPLQGDTIFGRRCPALTGVIDGLTCLISLLVMMILVVILAVKMNVNDL